MEREHWDGSEARWRFWSPLSLIGNAFGTLWEVDGWVAVMLLVSTEGRAEDK